MHDIVADLNACLTSSHTTCVLWLLGSPAIYLYSRSKQEETVAFCNARLASFYTTCAQHFADMGFRYGIQTLLQVGRNNSDSAIPRTLFGRQNRAC